MLHDISYRKNEVQAVRLNSTGKLYPNGMFQITMDGHLSTYRKYSLEQLIIFCKPGFNNKGINTTTVHFIRESMGNTQTNYYGVNLRIEEKMGGVCLSISGK